MTPKIRVDRYNSNIPGFKISDALHWFQSGFTKHGDLVVRFHTADKYINVDHWGSGYDGETHTENFLLYPNLYEEGKELEPFLEDYKSHPDYWCVELAVEMPDNTNYDYRVIPLKHEYFVVLTPLYKMLDYGCLNPIEVDIDEKTRNC